MKTGLRIETHNMDPKIFQEIISDSPDGPTTIVSRVINLADKELENALVKNGWRKPGIMEPKGSIDGIPIIVDHTMPADTIEIRCGSQAEWHIREALSPLMQFITPGSAADKN